MKTTMQEEQKLTLKDRSNLNVAIKQTVKLSKFSLRKRITVLKREWWYWDDLIQSESITEIFSDETIIKDDVPTLTKDQENDTEEILQLFTTNQDEMVHTNRHILIQ
jgi:hypothetical protein